MASEEVSEICVKLIPAASKEELKTIKIAAFFSSKYLSKNIDCTLEKENKYKIDNKVKVNKSVHSISMFFYFKVIQFPIYPD